MESPARGAFHALAQDGKATCELMHEVDELLAGVHVEFGVDVLGVGGGRLARDDESVAHVRYRSAARQEVEHLGLARGEAAAFGKLEDGGRSARRYRLQARREQLRGVRAARIRDPPASTASNAASCSTPSSLRAPNANARPSLQHEHGGAHQQRDGHDRHLVAARTPRPPCRTPPARASPRPADRPSARRSIPNRTTARAWPRPAQRSARNTSA